MDLVAIVMVLSAAVIHAVWNLLAKRSDDPLAYFCAIAIVALLVYAAPFLYLMRDVPIEWDWFRFALASGGLHAVYFVLLAMAYERADLSFAYPIARGTGIVLVPLLAVPVFGDHPTVVAWMGIGLVVAGLLWLHRPLFAAALDRGDARGLFSWPALLTGCTIATYSLNDTAGVARAQPIVYLYYVYVLTVVGIGPYVLWRKRAALGRAFANRRPLIVGGIGSFGTYMIVLAATRLAPVSYVVPMRETSIVIGSVLAARLLNESLGATRLTACCLVVAGVIAIGVGG